jgi:hypothetical protein
MTSGYLSLGLDGLLKIRVRHWSTIASGVVLLVLYAAFLFPL